METIINTVSFEWGSLDEAFPNVDPGVDPLGSRILVQVRQPKTVTKGGIILTTETRETEAWNTQVAKVVKLGPLAFRNREKMTPWPEGDWVQPGDFVRVPKYGGDKWTVKFGPNNEDEALFVLFNDLDLIGKVTGDPLGIKAFV